MNFPYPPTPVFTETGFLEPTSSFRSNAWKVFGSIIFFIILYLTLLAAAIMLCIGCWYGGLIFILGAGSFLGLIIGLAIWALGALIVIFLVKFFFQRQKNDLSGMIEITEEDEPVLFAFIRRITDEAGAPFPKKIFLSSDVNASVFYDSSFWSMFLPVRKNLVIGLGLVNSINLSEFKAIMGHEFGHFSQNSMKLGSYIYHVNKVIYNLLNENEGYQKLLDKMSGIHAVLAISGIIAATVVKGIQKLLAQVYGVINRSYSGLSLQMEFHADAVAASIAGSNHLAGALYRTEATALCYNRLIGYYNSWIGENLKPRNAYIDHTFVIKHFSKEFDTPIHNGLLQTGKNTMDLFNNSNVVVKDQWASHPSTAEREQALEQINLQTPDDNTSPWILFSNPLKTQEQMTEMLFAKVEFEHDPLWLEAGDFEQKYTTENERYNLHPAFNNYYNNREIETFDLELTTDNPAVTLPDDEQNSLPKRIETNSNDLVMLEQIGSAKIKSFDYKGTKYPHSERINIKAIIEKEQELLSRQLRENDQRMYRMAMASPDNVQTAALTVAYKAYFNMMNILKPEKSNLEELRAHIMEAYYDSKPFDQATAWNTTLKEKEKVLINGIKRLLDIPEVSVMVTSTQNKVFRQYLDNVHQYFVADAYINESLDILNLAMQYYLELLADYVFMLKKKMLDIQATLLLSQLES